VRKLTLSAAGYDVLTATDGESALRAFIQDHVDLVITDQFLPDNTGGQLAAEMKRLKPKVPVILYTGMMDAPADARNFDLILSKGMAPPEFLAAIGKVVAKSQLGENM
jgi:two-component system cell cycle sensor histidine kinase/response regulator CckA